MSINVSWKLPEYLKANNLSVYKLDKELSGRVSTRTLYAWGKNAPERPDLGNLGLVIGALRRLTGKPVTPNDLLEVIEEPEPLEEWDAESKAWHDAALAPPLEPYDWGGIDPETLGVPVVNGMVQE